MVVNVWCKSRLFLASGAPPCPVMGKRGTATPRLSSHSWHRRRRPPWFSVAQMLECDGKPTSMWKSQPMYKIGRQDVANLLVAAMAHKRGAKSTLSCSWGKDKKREG